MIDEELQLRAVETVRVAAALIAQDAHNLAVTRLPASREQRLELLAEVASIGRDVAVLADACAVLIRRGPAYPNHS
jgi:hypothetical protein